jgi:hypothetical protein
MGWKWALGRTGSGVAKRTNPYRFSLPASKIHTPASIVNDKLGLRPIWNVGILEKWVADIAILNGWQNASMCTKWTSSFDTHNSGVPLFHH